MGVKGRVHTVRWPLLLRRLQQPSELHPHMDLHTHQQRHLQEDQLQLPDTCRGETPAAHGGVLPPSTTTTPLLTTLTYLHLPHHYDHNNLPTRPTHHQNHNYHHPTKQPMAGWLTDVVDGAGTELPIEFLGTEASQVMDGKWPEVQHIVSGKGLPLFQQYHPEAKEAQLHRRPQATGPRPHHYTLADQRKRGSIQESVHSCGGRDFLPERCCTYSSGAESASATLVLLLRRPTLQLPPEGVSLPVVQPAPD